MLNLRFDVVSSEFKAEEEVLVIVVLFKEARFSYHCHCKQNSKTMAPNAKTRLVYEDEETFAESYQKKGELLPVVKRDVVSRKNKRTHDFRSCDVNYLRLFFYFPYEPIRRIPNLPDFVRQRQTSACEACLSGSSQSDPAILLERCHASDRVETRLRRRWLRSLHSSNLQEGHQDR